MSGGLKLKTVRIKKSSFLSKGSPDSCHVGSCNLAAAILAAWLPGGGWGEDGVVS